MRNNVTYLDYGKESIHDALAYHAEDAEIDGVIMVVKRGDVLSLEGGNISVGEMAVAALLMDEAARDMAFGVPEE